MLEDVQERLLRSLAAAARNTSDEERTEFLVSASMGEPGVTISHPGLPEGAMTAYGGDLRLLEAHGYLLIGRRTDRDDFDFDVTPAGFAHVGLLRASARRWGPWEAVGEKPVASSAMSNVWRVVDTRTDDGAKYALKEMRYRKTRGSTAYKRFVQEIEILGDALKERHPSIVRVVDYAVPEEGNDTEPYYVMPLAESSLQRARKQFRGRLEQVLEIALPIARALDVAHEAGVIHRDVKPGNVLLFGEEREPALCDFGIAFMEDDERLTHTEAQTVGTMDFVAPELHGGGQSDEVTPAADVYSLGKTIYAAVAGGDVFPREWIDDPRFDLAAKFGDGRLAHLTGIMDLMVTERRQARLQTMSEVEELLERVLDNVRRGVAYKEGMYRGSRGPQERLQRVERVLGMPSGVAREDGLHDLVDDAVVAAGSVVSAALEQNRGASPVVGEQPASFASAAAADAAEVLLSIGLPLVRADERDAFEEWLGLALAPLEEPPGRRDAAERIVLSASGVLAAYACGAVAWERRRFQLLRSIMDRYVARARYWSHQGLFANSASKMEPWLTRTMAESALLKHVAPPVAEDPARYVHVMSGLAAVRLLQEASPGALDAFVANPVGDFPVVFAPGFINVAWAAELLDVLSTRAPVERSVARDLFDLDPEQLRALFRRLTPTLVALHERAAHDVHVVPFYGLGVDARRWQAWCGYGGGAGE